MGTTPTITKSEFSGYTQIKDEVCNATPEKDVMAGPCRLMSVAYHNPETTDEYDYLQFYDNLNPTVGTTDPDFIVRLEKGMGTTVGDEEWRTIPCNPPNGWKFSNGLSFACVKTKGGSDNPTNTVLVTLTCLPGVS